MKKRHIFIASLLSLVTLASCNGNNDNPSVDGYTEKDMVISALPKTEILVDETTTLSVANATLNKLVTWSSKDDSVCTINNDGIVKGLKEGSCELNATYKTLQSAFTVSVIPNTSTFDIVLSNENVNLNLESTFNVSCYSKYQGEVLLDRVNYSWSTQDVSVVDIAVSSDSDEVTIIPKGVGETEVIVSATYKGVYSSNCVYVNVSEHSVVFDVVPDYEDPDITIEPAIGGYDVTLKGYSSQFDFYYTVYVDGEEIVNPEVYFTSTNPNICEVFNHDDSNDNAAYFLSKSEGDCVIEANYKTFGGVLLFVRVE